MKGRLFLAFSDYWSWSNTRDRRNCKGCWEELEEWLSAVQTARLQGCLQGEGSFSGEGGASLSSFSKLCTVAATQKVTEWLKPRLEARLTCKDIWGNGWVGYEPFYPHYACPSHFEFSLLKFAILVYSLIKLCFQNLKVLVLMGSSLQKKVWRPEHLRALTSSGIHHRLLQQLLFMIFLSVSELCLYFVYVAFIPTSFFLLK